MKHYLFIFIILNIVLAGTAKAQYSNGGTGRYQSSLYWLSWQLESDPHAVGLVSANCGASLSSSSGGTVSGGTYIWNVVPDKIRIVGFVDQLSGSLKSNDLQGGWSTGFNTLYPMAKTVGIGSDWGTATFNITLTVQYNRGSLSSPVWTVMPDIPGTVIADAESLSSKNGEYISATVSAADSALGWELWEYNKGALSSSNTNYKVEIDNSNGVYTARLTSSNDARESAVLFARGTTRLTNVSVYGAASQYFTLGVVLPFDYGDAMLSYGSSPHFLSSLTDNGSNHILGGGTYAASSVAGAYTYAPASKVWLGAQRPDADTGFQASIAATKDNTTGLNDEDGAVTGDIVNGVSNTMDIPVIANNTAGTPAYLYGWLDANKNGLFESSEMQLATVPANVSNGTLTLSFDRGNLNAGDNVYVRLRIASSQLADKGADVATCLALDGEAEDYVVPVTYQVLVHAYDDGTGITDNTVYGKSLNSADNTLFGYLVNDDNKIVAKSAIGSYAEGKALLTAPEGIAYHAVISGQEQPVGSVFQSFSSADWLYCGSDKRVQDLFYGNNQYGGGTTVTTNDLVKVYPNTKSIRVGEISYAFNKRPVAANKSYSFDKDHMPSVGIAYPLVSLVDTDINGLGQLTGNDLEDGILNGTTSPTVVIKSLPASGLLLYQDKAVTEGQVIPNYKTADLAFKFTDLMGNYKSISFQYALRDKAFVESNIATYRIAFDYKLLPVTLIGLHASLQNENSVLLSWTTASEVNSQIFEVQRSTDDGKTWISIGRLDAAGNSNVEKKYRFVDQYPEAANNYRLKMIDADGSFKVSNITPTIYLKQSAQHIRLYPNPANDHLYFNQVTMGATWKLLDMTGKVYQSGNVTKLPQEVNINSLSSGVYLIQVINENDKYESARFIKK